jgi:hypothetical protein
MAKPSHSRTSRSYRSLPRQPLPRRQPVRHPRQARHHTAKGYPARAPFASGLGCACLSGSRLVLTDTQFSVLLVPRLGKDDARLCDQDFVCISEDILWLASCGWRSVAHGVICWRPLFIYVGRTYYEISVTSPLQSQFGRQIGYGVPYSFFN